MVSVETSVSLELLVGITTRGLLIGCSEVVGISIPDVISGCPV